MASPRHATSEDKLMDDFYHGSPKEKRHLGRSADTQGSSEPPAGRLISPPKSNRKESEATARETGHQLADSIFAEFCRTLQKCNKQQLNALVVFVDELPSLLRSLRPLTDHYKSLSRDAPPNLQTPSDMYSSH